MIRRRFLAILLVAPLALAAASGANAQVVICPKDCTIVGNETITGPVIVNGGGTPSPVMTIDSRLALEGPISITEGVQTSASEQDLDQRWPRRLPVIPHRWRFSRSLNGLPVHRPLHDANGDTLGD